MDIKSVLAAIKRGRRVVQYKTEEDTRKLDVGGTVYDVPKVIGITDCSSTEENHVTYSNGTAASSALKIDTSLSTRYLAVSARASVSYAIEKTYNREYQWAMYTFNAGTYLASLRNYTDLLAETALASRLEDMVAIGDGNNKDVVQDWKDFFTSWGSHVIIKAALGARFQLNVWASNSNSSVNERFSTSVTTSFNGIGAGGRFDASVTTEEQYKTFSEYMQKQVSVVGGNPAINRRLTADPTQYEAFVEWASSVSENPSITTLNVVELWVLMKDASKKEVRDAAGKVLDAYNYIVSHPQPYKTAVVFDIQSDWAEFNLLSPDAIIISDPNHPHPPPNTVASGTRVQWGRKYNHYYQRQTLRFYIINDGSPINFSISRGSDGARLGVKGRAAAIIDGQNYLNDMVTDNVWNTAWFYQKPVSANPATTGLTSAAHMQNEVLGACNTLISHFQPYRTAVVFDIQSDWGEFNLLSPDSVIIPDPNNPYPQSNTISSRTRVYWGKWCSHDYQRQTLRFYIINDGSPVNFSISRGSDGPRLGVKGRAEAIIEGATYLNDKNTDNVWNTAWFYQKPVSANAASTGLILGAYNSLISHFQPYRTAVVFHIQSDWGEFNLLSPESRIIPDPNNPYLPSNTPASSTRVYWGKECSHDHQSQTLRFYIINNGSPINFSISRGSDGARLGVKGRAEAIIEGVTYVNDKNTDNVWNTAWFYQKPVSANPATTSLERTRATRTWNDVLTSIWKRSALVVRLLRLLQ
ncbi:MAC/Perforin domain-containing protein [Pisolithus marmoratus]|nr:MAC/Perforin domain-containing protein [Pisolithus marmoratus]